MIMVTVLIPREGSGTWTITSLYGDSLILLLDRFPAMRFGHFCHNSPIPQTTMHQLYVQRANFPSLCHLTKQLISFTQIPLNFQCSARWSHRVARIFPVRLHSQFSDASYSLPIHCHQCPNHAAQRLLLPLGWDSRAQSWHTLKACLARREESSQQ